MKLSSQALYRVQALFDLAFHAQHAAQMDAAELDAVTIAGHAS